MEKSDKGTVLASEAPNVTWLAGELSRAYKPGVLDSCDDIRYTRWEGQDDDGRKWQRNMPAGRTVFPFDGASDTRIPLVDDVINWCVDLCTTSFWRAGLKVNAAEASDMQQAQVGQRVMDYLVGSRLYNEFCQEVELLAQYGWTYSWAALAVTWQQETSLKKQRMTVEQVAQLVPGIEDLLANEEATDQVAELLLGFAPHLKKRRALQLVGELRREGVVEIPYPAVTRNSPSIAALQPHVDIVIPDETIDIQDAPVVFRRMMMTEARIRSMAAVEGWNQEWVEEAVKAGNQSPEAERTTAVSRYSVQALGSNLIEVVWAYQKLIDDDDIPGVYCTVFNPAVTKTYGSHELLDYGHGQYPFVIYRPEIAQRRVTDSRGVPDIAFTWQAEMKIQRDSISDYTSFATLPTLEVPKSRAGNLNLRPGGQLSAIPHFHPPASARIIGCSGGCGASP